MYKNHNCIPTTVEVIALCKCNDFSQSLGTFMIFFLCKMTPVLLQGRCGGMRHFMTVLVSVILG